MNLNGQMAIQEDLQKENLRQLEIKMNDDNNMILYKDEEFNVALILNECRKLKLDNENLIKIYNKKSKDVRQIYSKLKNYLKRIASSLVQSNTNRGFEIDDDFLKMYIAFSDENIVENCIFIK